MGEEVKELKQKEPVNFEFLIQDSDGTTQMKNNLTSSLPNFHGLASEDPYTFLL